MASAVTGALADGEIVCRLYEEEAELNELVTGLSQDSTTPWTTDDEAVEYANDPKAFYLRRCKYFVSQVSLGTNNILVATYFMPEMTKLIGPGGKPVDFFISSKTQDETKWQGRVGLLVAKGPLAWKSDDRVDFGGTNYELGDWVCYDRQDGRQISINRVHCRRLKDVDVWGKTDDPHLVY